MIQQEASGNKIDSCLHLLHAENQLMSVEGFKIIEDELIRNYVIITALESKIKQKKGDHYEKNLFIL